MLVIGDPVTKEYVKDYKVKRIGIIHTDEQLAYIEETLNLKRGEAIDEKTRRYFNDDKIVTLYNASKSQLLKDLLLISFATDNRFKLAPSTISYSMLVPAVMHLHLDVEEWEGKIKTLLEIKRNVMKPLVKFCYNTTYLTEITDMSQLLLDWIGTDYNLKIESYEYSEYKRYTRDSILDVVKTNTGESHFKALYNNHLGYISEQQWKAFDYNDRLHACMDSLYADTINEYIIPNIFTADKYGDVELLRLFKTSIMNRISQVDYKFFNQFILDNYSVIIGSYNKGFYVSILNSIKYNLLNES